MMHFSTLHHLLLLESILWERHVWYELFPGTHVCEIEGFHMVINRQIQIRNVHARVFYNRDLPNYMDMYPKTYDSSEVSTLLRNDPNLHDRDMVLSHVWIKKHVYIPRWTDFQVKSLKDLSRFQITYNMIFKRLAAFTRRVTHPVHVDHPHIIENGEYFVQWKKAYKNFFQENMFSKKRNGISAYQITPEQVSCIMHDSMDYPIEMLLKIMREVCMD